MRFVTEFSHMGTEALQELGTALCGLEITSIIDVEQMDAAGFVLLSRVENKLKKEAKSPAGNEIEHLTDDNDALGIVQELMADLERDAE